MDFKDLDKLIDEDGAAELLSVSPRTLQAWRASGKGPEFVRIGRQIRYTLRAIIDHINANTHGKAA